MTHNLILSSDEYMKVNKILDVSGLECPLPLLKTKLELSRMSKDEIIQVIASDPTSSEDFKAFERISGNVILNIERQKKNYVYFILKKND